MADALTEFRKIVSDRDAAWKELRGYEKPLLTRVETLSKKKRKTGLDAAEEEELADTQAAMEKVHHGMWVVGQVSLQAMNDSALLRDIKNSLKGVSSDLEKTKAKLGKIAKIAEVTAKVTTALVALAEKVGNAVA
jgi:hypothetical protein